MQTVHFSDAGFVDFHTHYDLSLLRDHPLVSHASALALPSSTLGDTTLRRFDRHTEIL